MKSQKISTASDQYFLSYVKKLQGVGQIDPPPSRNRVNTYCLSSLACCLIALFYLQKTKSIFRPTSRHFISNTVILTEEIVGFSAEWYHNTELDGDWWQLSSSPPPGSSGKTTREEGEGAPPPLIFLNYVRFARPPPGNKKQEQVKFPGGKYLSG